MGGCLFLTQYTKSKEFKLTEGEGGWSDMFIWNGALALINSVTFFVYFQYKISYHLSPNKTTRTTLSLLYFLAYRIRSTSLCVIVRSIITLQFSTIFQIQSPDVWYGLNLL